MWRHAPVCVLLHTCTCARIIHCTRACTWARRSLPGAARTCAPLPCAPVQKSVLRGLLPFPGCPVHAAVAPLPRLPAFPANCLGTVGRRLAAELYGRASARRLPSIQLHVALDEAGPEDEEGLEDAEGLEAASAWGSRRRSPDARRQSRLTQLPVAGTTSLNPTPVAIHSSKVSSSWRRPAGLKSTSNPIS